MSDALDRTNELLRVNELVKYFPVRSGFWNRVSGHVHAVDNVSFSVTQGETLGLVGESGCGKTTLGRSIVRGIEPTSGGIHFRTKGGEVIDLAQLSRKELRAYRSDFQMVFQDPYSSLDPRMSVLDIIAEPLKIHGFGTKTEIEERVKYLASVVGLKIEHLKRYPHAFSGGQRQRIGVARALATNPALIIADEPVSALDVSIQAQVLNLLKELQGEFNLTYVFVAHDLSVVEYISDRVAVMYLGKIVELAPTRTLFAVPKHPYTEALLSAVPKPAPDGAKNHLRLEGEVPNPANPPRGCRFHTRCRYAKDVCRTDEPPLEEVAEGQFVACHFAKELDLRGVTASGVARYELPSDAVPIEPG